MPRANPIQTNFTAGEISPTLRGRVDITRYQNGAQTLKNFIVKPQGGLFARPGSVFMREVKDSSKKTRLIEFEFSEVINYLLEFGNGYVRIHKDGVYVGTEVVSPYLEADLPYLKYTQSADVLYICHPSYQTRKLTRTSDVIWTMSLYQQDDGPYLAVNTTPTQLWLANYTYTARIHSSANDFVIGDIGKYVEYSKGGIPLLALITGYTDAKNVNVTVKQNILEPIDPVAILTRGVASIESSHPVFSNNVVGNYIKISPGNWDFITRYVSETEVDVTAGTYAVKDFGTVGTGVIDSTLRATRDGTSGNDIFVQMVGDSGAGVVVNVVGDAVVVHYQDAVSTVAQIEAAITALTGADKIIEVSVAGTGASVPNSPADDIPPTNLAGATGPITLVPTNGFISLLDPDIAASVIATENTFVATDVGRHIRLNFSGAQVWGTIFFYTSATEVSVHWADPIPLKDRDPTVLVDDGQTTAWRLGAWGTTVGWPSVVTFHEERLVFAASPLEPQTFWMSVSGDYENMAPTDSESKVLDDNAITFTIASNKVNGIRWAVSGPTLVFGSIGGEWQVSASTPREALTPTNISVVPHTAHGSGHIRPIKAGSAVLYIQRTGTKLRELVYDYQIDALVAKDITIISEHILRRGGKAMEVAYQQEPNNVMWVALEDGGLAGLTYVKDQDVYAWHYHEMGGSFSGGKAVVESIAVLPNSSGTYDTLYMIVKRTIDGVTKRFMEYIDLEYDPPTETSREALYYVDCGIKYVGAAVSTITLGHLIGQTVQILANGSARPDVVVSAAGVATFVGGAAATISGGLPYESILVTLPPEVQGEGGTAQGKLKRMHKLKIRVYKSMGMKYGPSLTKLSQYNFRNTGDPMDAAPRIRSDDVPFTMENTYDYDATVVIKRDQPYPLNILAIMPEIVVNE
jgi:hypothetical protein